MKRIRMSGACMYLGAILLLSGAMIFGCGGSSGGGGGGGDGGSGGGTGGGGGKVGGTGVKYTSIDQFYNDSSLCGTGICRSGINPPNIVGTYQADCTITYSQFPNETGRLVKNIMKLYNYNSQTLNIDFQEILITTGQVMVTATGNFIRGDGSSFTIYQVTTGSWSDNCTQYGAAIYSGTKSGMDINQVEFRWKATGTSGTDCAEANQYVGLYKISNGKWIYQSGGSDGGGGLATITLSLTDMCNDGYYIEYKYYDVTNNLVWPSATEHWNTPGYAVKASQNLSCYSGAKICYGARCGSSYWGIGLDGDKSCTSCCVTCTDGLSQEWNLTCP